MAEAAGVASVSLVCEGFQGQALATGRGLGFDGMRMAVLHGHVDAQSTAEMIESLLTHTLDEIVHGLTVEEAGDNGGVAEPAALDTAARGTIDEINRVFRERGWSDGSPIIPPTHERVQAMIDVWGYDPWRVLSVARPSGRDITVWSIAVNAVMVGLTAEYLPLVMALASALADEHYGVEHSGNTTGADALVVLNGAVVTDLGFNHGPGALRDGTYANTAVGRWVRLFLRNVCGFTVEEHDKATFGNSSHVVLAEDEAALREIGWPSLAADFGHRSGENAVTVARMNSGVLIGSVFGSTPEAILPYLADGFVRVSSWELTHVYGLGQGQYRPLLVLSPLLARTFARAGWSKDDVRAALYQSARIPAWKFETYIGEWSNLTAGRRTLVDLAAAGLVPPDFGVSDDPNRLVPIVTSPDCFLIAVAGDRNRANAYTMSNDGPHGNWTSKPIDLEYSTDLMCSVPPR